MDATEERMDANTKAMQESMERQIGSLVSIMEATRKTCRDEIKQGIRAGQEHVKEIMEIQSGSLAAKLDGCRKLMQADREARKTTDLKADPEEMETETEQWEVPKDRAAVKPVGGLRKRHRGRKLAAGRRGEPEELTRGDCGSGWKLAASGRKVSRRARVAWRNMHIIRNKWTRAQRMGEGPGEYGRSGRVCGHATKTKRE
jgi:hypothetical protein